MRWRFRSLLRQLDDVICERDQVHLLDAIDVDLRETPFGVLFEQPDPFFISGFVGTKYVRTPLLDQRNAVDEPGPDAARLERIEVDSAARIDVPKGFALVLSEAEGGGEELNLPILLKDLLISGSIRERLEDGPAGG